MDRLASSHHAGDAGPRLSCRASLHSRRGNKAHSIAKPICCRSPCRKCAACCGTWSGADRLIMRLRAPGRAGAAGTSSGLGKAIGNDVLLPKSGCSTKQSPAHSTCCRLSFRRVSISGSRLALLPLVDTPKTGSVDTQRGGQLPEQGAACTEDQPAGIISESHESSTMAPAAAHDAMREWRQAIPNDLLANARLKPAAKPLTTFRAELIGYEEADWEDLFAGYTSLKAITFSSSIEMLLRLAERLDEVEVVFGSESILSKEHLALAQASQTVAAYGFADALIDHKALVEALSRLLGLAGRELLDRV